MNRSQENPYDVSHLTDEDLDRELPLPRAKGRRGTAIEVAWIAEYDARQLFLPTYTSMHDYCVRKLLLSEDCAFKRIRAARVSRRFPAILPALTEGRLHLSGIALLAKHLTQGNGAELLAAAEHVTLKGIKRLLAERFPQDTTPTLVSVSHPTPSLLDQQAARPVETSATRANPSEQTPITRDTEILPRQPGGLISTSVQQAARPVPADERGDLTPIARDIFRMKFTIGQTEYADLVHAQELLSHQIPSGDVAKVFGRALKALIRELEKTKFAATDRPRNARKKATTGRYIPAHVKHAVRVRDGRQCTFVGDDGRRCTERRFLEFHHHHEFARGGAATVENLRLRCRPHNHYEATLSYGAEFMRRKSESARAC